MVERKGSTIMGHTVQGENKMKSFEEWYEDSGRTISPSVLVQALPFGKDAYTAATEQCRQEIDGLRKDLEWALVTAKQCIALIDEDEEEMQEFEEHVREIRQRHKLGREG